VIAPATGAARRGAKWQAGYGHGEQAGYGHGERARRGEGRADRQTGRRTRQRAGLKFGVGLQNNQMQRTSAAPATDARR
jgi:hypothetical protein